MTIKKLLETAAKAYYMGIPTMSNEEFDKLSRYTNWENVGYSIEDSLDRYPHLDRLYSLQNIFEGEPEPLYPSESITSPKLDGAAISIFYNTGKLVKALTRGDGIEGIDITDKISLIAPNSIPIKDWMVQITGEVVVPKQPNARNVAAGALNLKDLEEFKSRNLTFIAYGMSPSLNETWSKDLDQVLYMGFRTVLESNWDQFPQDGEVNRVNNNKHFLDLGFTAHHPRGAYALKAEQMGVITELLDVIWQVGKSGVVSPVAILQPCIIGGASIRKATLHNISYIKELGLELGCLVEVIRAGEIIPRIVRRV